MDHVVCYFEGCNKKRHIRGLCVGHYRQWKRGNPLKPLRFKRTRNTQPCIRFTEQPCSNPDLTGPCHVFSGSISPDGYGHVNADGKIVGVHRYVWELEYGAIIDGLVIDHACRNRACCNVNHLRLVTKHQNSTENVVGSFWQLNKAKTHCPQGHEYTVENTAYTGRRRYCKACKREKQRQRKVHV